VIHVFIDESGDLGWTLDRPYGQGGSSRHLTLAFLVADQRACKYPKRVAKRASADLGISRARELKGSQLSGSDLLRFANQSAKMLVDHPAISVCTITVKKQNVQPHIRSDANKLYNYMLNLSLPDYIKTHPEVVLSPDPRSIKVASGNSLVDYLQTQLWFEHNSVTILHHQPLESHQSLVIQFVDVISHIIWRHHEHGFSDAYRVLAPHISCKHLFFGKGGMP